MRGPIHGRGNRAAIDSLRAELTAPASGVLRLFWTAPLDPGADAVAYDVIRSASADDFLAAADCLASDISDLEADDADSLP